MEWYGMVWYLVIIYSMSGSVFQLCLNSREEWANYLYTRFFACIFVLDHAEHAPNGHLFLQPLPVCIFAAKTSIFFKKYTSPFDRYILAAK